MVSKWMKGNGLRLAKEKTKVVLIIMRWKYDPLKLELEGHPIQIQESVKYMGV